MNKNISFEGAKFVVKINYVFNKLVAEMKLSGLEMLGLKCPSETSQYSSIHRSCLLFWEVPYTHPDGSFRASAEEPMTYGALC